jgi:hypothetical protein
LGGPLRTGLTPMSEHLATNHIILFAWLAHCGRCEAGTLVVAPVHVCLCFVEPLTLQNHFVCPPRAQADASSRQTRRQSFSALSPRPAWGVGEHEGRRRKGCWTDGSGQQEARTLTQQRGWDVQQQQTVIRRTHQARQAGQANLLCESILSVPRIEY